MKTQAHPTLVVQLSTREKVTAFRAGLGDVSGIVALGIDQAAFWTLSGIDALYLSLTRSERWGSRPIPPYTVALLHTTEDERRAGMPPFIITGLVLGNDDPNTAEFAIPLMGKAILRMIDELNTKNPGAIRTLGFFEFELGFPGSGMADVARSLAKSFARQER